VSARWRRPRRAAARKPGESRLLRPAPAIRGDYRDTEAPTEIIRTGAPRAWDGTTFSGASGAGQAYPHGHFTGIGAETAWHPAPAREEPPRTHSAAGHGWAMTVNTEGPGVPMDDRARRARQFLDLKVAYLESEDMGYRIDDAGQIRESGEKLDGRSVIARAGREGSAHLLGPRPDWLTRQSDRPWEPAGGWDGGWAAGVPWLDPDDPAAAWHEEAGA